MTDLEQQDLFEVQEAFEFIKIIVNADGGNYKTNPGPGGTGLIFRCVVEDILHLKTIARSIPRMMELKGEAIKLAKRGKKKKPIENGGKWYMETTNNRCEILAIIEAMARCKDPARTHLIVYTDSQWAMNMTLDLWKAKENLDLVMRARELAKKIGLLEIKWLRGHAGDRFNEWSDKLATKAAAEQNASPVIERFKESI